MDDAHDPPRLEEVLITDQLERRPTRPPDHAAESAALGALAAAMATEPARILAHLSDAAMRLTRADSAGISILEPGGTDGIFRWVATSGAYTRHLDGRMARAESPCGEVIARDRVLLFDVPERIYPAFRRARPVMREGLLAPFHVDGRPAGTVWVVKHAAEGRFDREDARLLDSLSRFAAAAYRMTTALEAARAGRAELERRVEERTRALRESEEGHAFLLGLSDALRPLDTPGDIAGAAARLLGERLGADRVCYGEVAGDRLLIERDHARGVPSLVGEHRLDGFTPGFLAAYRPGGGLVTVDDVATDGRLGPAARAELRARGIAAFADIVLLGDDRRSSILAVQHATARRWAAAELALVRNVADRVRTAIERARAEAALRESEELFRAFAENSADTIWILAADGTRLDYLSPAFERMFGEPREALLRDLRRWRDLVHPEDLEGTAGYLPRAMAGEMAVVHYRVVRPDDGRVVHLRDTGFPIFDEAGAVRRVAGIVQDISDIHAATAAVEAEKERFRSLAEGIPQLIWRSSDDGLWTWASPQWLAHTGQRQEATHGRGWLDAIHPDDRVTVLAAWAGARAQGRLEVECRVRRAADGAWRWHQSRSRPMRGERRGGGQGPAVDWLGTTSDIEDLKRLQGQQTVLVAELQHRTRNMLAIVRGIARKSVPPSPGFEDYDQRLTALARVQGFLARTGRYTVPLFDLVEAELLAAGDGRSERVTIEGPPVTLPGEGVQLVALALHELATNAVKYGALAQPRGRLAIAWDAAGPEPAQRLRITWRESGVAMPGGPPTREGYGTELITRALPYQLNAETRLDFAPDGVRCEILLPPGAFRRAEPEG